jgi:ureidoglycolate hydrolase
MVIKKKINPDNFKKFGRVIEYAGKKTEGSNLFRIVLKEKEPFGWRIAYLVVREKKISRLEQHKNSFESFEPVKGRSLIYVAREKEPSKIECFYLERPVVLNKGVWHGVVTLDKESEIKISENASVRSIYWKLLFALP